MTPWIDLGASSLGWPAAIAPIASAIHVYWTLVPLILAISLVYSASRHETWPRIWIHSLRIGGMICGILLVTTAVLLLVNTQV